MTSIHQAKPQQRKERVYAVNMIATATGSRKFMHEWKKSASSFAAQYLSHLLHLLSYFNINGRECTELKAGCATVDAEYLLIDSPRFQM